MITNKTINTMRIVITFTAIISVMFISVGSVTAGGIAVEKIPGGGVRTITFTDSSGKVIKKLDVEIEGLASSETQMATFSGIKVNRRVELLGNSNYALVTEHVWPVESFDGRVQEVVRLYDAKENVLYSLNVSNSTPQALSETGISIFLQSPAEDWVGTEEEKSKLSDKITVYDISGNRVFEHKESPYTVSRVAISPNAKWLVLSAREKRPSRLKALVRINLNTFQVHRETATTKAPMFTYHSVLDNGSLIKISDIGGPVLPDGSIKRVKKTIVLKQGIP